MLLPLCGFFMALIVFGGLASLVVYADPYEARKAPLAYAAFLAGLGAPAAVLIVAGVMIPLARAGFVVHHLIVAAFALLVFAGCVCGGALLGYRRGVAHKARHGALVEWSDSAE